MRPSRSSSSSIVSLRQNTAITSEATVMSKPSSRGKPLAGPPRPTVISRKRAVVHVERAPPGDAAHVDVERIAPVDVIVEHRGEQIVRRGDGVEIAGEMQVDVVHRRDLRMSAAGRAALLPEAGAERGLAQADRRALADAHQAVAEADRRRRLAFARRRRVDRGDEDQLALAPPQLQESASILAIVRP